MDDKFKDFIDEVEALLADESQTKKSIVLKVKTKVKSSKNEVFQSPKMLSLVRRVVVHATMKQLCSFFAVFASEGFKARFCFHSAKNIFGFGIVKFIYAIQQQSHSEFVVCELYNDHAFFSSVNFILGKTKVTRHIIWAPRGLILIFRSAV